MIPESCVQIIDALRRNLLFEMARVVTLLGLNCGDNDALSDDGKPSSLTSPPF